MRHPKIVEPIYVQPRDPLPNEAVLTVHVEDEAALRDLLWNRDDAEAVERGMSVMPNSTTIYVRCIDEDVAEEIWQAWLPYHPQGRRRRRRQKAQILR